MSQESETPKVKPADQPPVEKPQPPPAGNELSDKDLDNTTGGLLPAV